MGEDSRYDVAIQMQIDADDEEIPKARLQRAVEWVLARHNVAAHANVSVVVTDNNAVQHLNRTYRGLDKPTDVLSFPAEPLPFVEDEFTLGDLILALPYIQQQAKHEGHDWHDEMVLAVIHGTLHLLGYDHDTSEHQAAMWTVQAEALVAMDVSIEVPLFEFGAGDENEPDVDSAHLPPPHMRE